MDSRRARSLARLARARPRPGPWRPWRAAAFALASARRCARCCAASVRSLCWATSGRGSIAAGSAIMSAVTCMRGPAATAASGSFAAIPPATAAGRGEGGHAGQQRSAQGASNHEVPFFGRAPRASGTVCVTPRWARRADRAGPPQGAHAGARQAAGAGGAPSLETGVISVRDPPCAHAGGDRKPCTHNHHESVDAACRSDTDGQFRDPSHTGDYPCVTGVTHGVRPRGLPAGPSPERRSATAPNGSASRARTAGGP